MIEKTTIKLNWGNNIYCAGGVFCDYALSISYKYNKVHGDNHHNTLLYGELYFSLLPISGLMYVKSCLGGLLIDD